MSRRVLLVLLVVLVVLLVFTWVQLRHDRSALTTTLQVDEPVITVAREMLVDLEVVRQGTLTATFRRGESGWEVDEGPDGLATDLLPDLIYTWSMLRLVAQVTHDPGALAPYGLDPPVITLRSTRRSGGVVSLELGSASGLSDYVGYYARVDGRNEIVLVDYTADNLVSQVDQLLGLIEVMPE